MQVTTVLLGGRDLEMVEIAKLLATRPEIVVHDLGLGWGARASQYLEQIRDAIRLEQKIILIELGEDLPADFSRDQLTWVDHHNLLAGEHRKTSIEQVFELLKFERELWTRDHDLVAVNDRGHIKALKQFGATLEEIRSIRARDRRAQGITEAEELAGADAILKAEAHLDGKLTVVHLPNQRTATVTDPLDEALGGLGYQNLLVFCPNQTVFFGSGRCIEKLTAAYPQSWFGGELPTRGYWGVAKKLEVSDLTQLLKVAIMTIPAIDIKVQAFHHVLIWPLLMRGAATNSTDTDQSIEGFVEAFEKTGWSEAVGTNGTVHTDYAYDEIVYFHPFVRDFLFGDGSTEQKKRAVRRFKRNDIPSVTIGIDPGPYSKTAAFEFDYRVERTELLLIRPRVAMLLVEISNRLPTTERFADPPLEDPRKSLTLDQVMYLQSRIRHIYPPFFLGETIHGDCPKLVRWNGLANLPAGNPEDPSLTSASSSNDFADFTKIGAEPPVYAHWRAFFGSDVKPLRSAAGRTSGGLILQQLIDDRMPALSYIALEKPVKLEEIDPDDLDRLPAFDPPDLEYDPEFRKNLRDGLRYTRFRHWGTLYFCNGTSFTMLCEGKAPSYLLRHFRRHYTHLALLVQFQHAALLYFADELADTAKMLADRKSEHEFSDEQWRRRIRVIQHRFLKFRTRSHFSEVSNQIQGKDLFNFWMSHLGTTALFDRVSATNSQVYEALETFEARQLSDAQFWLGKIASVGGAVSLSLSVAALAISVASLHSNERREAMSFAGESQIASWLWFWLGMAGLPAILVGIGFAAISWWGFRKSK